MYFKPPENSLLLFKYTQSNQSRMFSKINQMFWDTMEAAYSSIQFMNQLTVPLITSLNVNKKHS